MSDSYTTIENAAAAALSRIESHSDSVEHEYIALIYQDPTTGEFKFTDPQSKQSRNKAKGTFRIPKGSLRALIHNHPTTGDDDRYLSGNDIATARKLGVPSFIGVDNSLLKWTGKTRKRGLQERGLTEEVLAQIPIEELKRQMAKRREEHNLLFAPPTGNPISAGNEMSRKRVERP